MTSVDKTVLGLAALLIFAGLSFAYEQRSEQQVQRDHYCEMVEIYKQSGGQYGWPAYDGEC